MINTKNAPNIDFLTDLVKAFKIRNEAESIKMISKKTIIQWKGGTKTIIDAISKNKKSIASIITINYNVFL